MEGAWSSSTWCRATARRASSNSRVGASQADGGRACAKRRPGAGRGLLAAANPVEPFRNVHRAAARRGGSRIEATDPMKLEDLRVKLFTDGADKAQIVDMASKPWI